MKILMVCIGNICRSPMAEYILKHKVKTNNLDWIVDSAGVEGHHAGEDANAKAIKTAAKYGIDMLAHTAQQLNEAHFETYDIIYIFAQDVMQKALLIAPNEEAKSKLFYFTNIITPNQNTNVTDPWYYDEQVYDQVFQLIDKHCEALINSHIHTIRKSDK